MTTAPLPVLSEKARKYLDGTSHVPNPFTTMSDDVKLGERLDNLAEFLASPAGSPEVINKTAGALLKGDLVYISGHDGTYPKVTKADADDPAKAATHVLLENININATGRAAMFATVEMDTSALTGGVLGSPLALSTVAGGIVLYSSAPSGADQKVQIVGVLSKAIGTDGEVYFFPGAMMVVKAGTSSLQAGTLAASVAGRAIMASAYFDLATALAKFDTDSIDNTWLLKAVTNGSFVADDTTRALFAANFIGATAVGRALMQTGFFDVAKTLDAFAANSWANAALIQIIADGSFQDDAATRALFATKIWTADKLALARNYILRGKNDTSGQAEAITGTAGQTPISDGTDVAFRAGDTLAITDGTNYLTTATLAGLLSALIVIAGGTDQATRAYSSGTSQEPADNATLVNAIASEMLTRRDEFTQLLLDETNPPTASAGRGLVVSGGVVAPQGVPDLTVSVTALDAYNQAGKRVKPAQVLALSGFTVPIAGGAERRDIVVCDSSGAIVRRVGSEGAPTQPDATLTAGDVPLARVVLTQGADTSIQAGNVTDLRQTAKSIDPTKILAGILPALITLARGSTLAGNSSGVAAAVDIVALGAILAGNGTDAVAVNLLTAALGGMSFTARSYAGGSLQEPAEDATLTAALGSLMLLRRDAIARLLLDDATPTATAGRGLVVSGAGVTPQGIADNTVAVAPGVAYNQQGRRVLCTSTPILAATTPNGLGGNRYDIVVIPAAGGAPVVREGTIITTDPVLIAGDVPLARLTCAAGAFTIAGGDIANLQETARTIPADKLLAASTTDLLVLLATDQITAAVLKQAIANGAFDDSAETLALFADGLWTITKMDASFEAQTSVVSIAGGNGAGKVGDLNSAPVELVAGVANKAIIPISMQLEFTGTTAYDGAGPANDLVPVYAGATGTPLLAPIDNGNGSAIRLVRAAPGTDYAYQDSKVSPPVDITPLVNTAVQLFVQGAEPFTAAGDIAIKVILRYKLIDCPMP